MKVIICGGRKYAYVAEDFSRLERFHQRRHVTLVISGAAEGADAFGELWAERRGIALIEISARWKKYGLAAGPIRNAQMLRLADAVVWFPGGRGTADMVKQAEADGVPTVEAHKL